jgi:hypothetical protein
MFKLSSLANLMLHGRLGSIDMFGPVRGWP